MNKFREPPTMTIAYTTDRAVPGASVGGARHAGFGWVVRGQANSSKIALKQTLHVCRMCGISLIYETLCFAGFCHPLLLTDTLVAQRLRPRQ